MRFYKCNTKHTLTDFNGKEHIINIGEVLVDSMYWWYRTIIVATPTKALRLIHNNTNIHYYDQFYSLVTLEELDKLKPHISSKLRWEYTGSINDVVLYSLPEQCCIPCGNEIIKNYNKELIIPEKPRSIGTCYKCNTTKVHLYSRSNFKII